MYDEIGYDWRAGKVALELAAVSGTNSISRRRGKNWLATSEVGSRKPIPIPPSGSDSQTWFRECIDLGAVAGLPSLADGYSLGEVAAHLGRSVNTVRNHTGAIYAAFGVHSQKELRARVRPELAKGIS